jgi:ATP-dependent HslUV protease ATP-binding subunit HslU
MLLATEGVDLIFTDAAIHEIARVAEEVNRLVENIGARRLHTVLERIVEEVSFSAPEMVAASRANGQERHVHVVDKEQVVEGVGALLKKQDLSKYIL